MLFSFVDCSTRLRDFSKSNSGVWTPTTRKGFPLYFFSSPWTHGKLRLQLIHMEVQTTTKITLSFSSVFERGLELIQDAGSVWTNSGRGRSLAPDKVLEPVENSNTPAKVTLLPSRAMNASTRCVGFGKNRVMVLLGLVVPGDKYPRTLYLWR